MVDLAYFQALVGKATIWRSAERLFDDLALQGYRANAVAYAVAWLAHHSQHRIDLDRIWKSQRLSTELASALQTACRCAHAHLNNYEGNVGEWSKRPECWDAYRQSEVSVGDAWKAGWAQEAYEPAVSEMGLLAQQWDEVRKHFLDDQRTIEGIERYTNRSWGLRSLRTKPISWFACKPFPELREIPLMRGKRIRDLIAMLSAAIITPTP